MGGEKNKSKMHILFGMRSLAIGPVHVSDEELLGATGELSSSNLIGEGRLWFCIKRRELF